MLHANSLKNPFMAGSLLQQRVEAEKQEIENMKMQLKIREQAGVLGSRHMDSNNSNNNDTALLSPGLLTAHYQQGGHGRGLSSTSSSTSISSSATSAYSFQQLQQQKQQQTLLSQLSPSKFGGPGTLIEQGEARAAQLIRSKSAGAGLLRPSNGVSANNNGTSTNGQRTRSRSRGPAEDRVAYGRPISPNSPRSPDFAPPMPQGPLLQFADADAMIQPGLLLDRARSTKQQQQQQSSSHSSGQRPPAGSRRPGGGHSQSHGQSQSTSTRGRVKPLIDLGNIHTGSDVIGPGLLSNGYNNYTTTSSSSSHHANSIPSGSSRSPRRTKPLLEF
ncbi:hypothetical protein EC991_002780 [Linnemannia zychae]|nr:hypothetical protein EC991_002780 [Linnemannia zychae]